MTTIETLSGIFGVGATAVGLWQLRALFRAHRAMLVRRIRRAASEGHAARPDGARVRKGDGEDGMKFIRELSGTIEEHLLDDRFFAIVCVGLIALGFALDAWSCR